MILRLRTGSETLILGPRAAFAAVAGTNDGALVSEYEVRRRLRIALADPETTDALRRAFARWREEGARIREADDRALIDRVARMSRGGAIVAFVVADRTKRLPRLEALQPGASSDRQQVAGMTFDRRIAATLQRVPNHLTGPAKEAFLALIAPESLAIAAGVLAIWAASHAVGVGEAIDVILAAVGLVFAGPEFWGGVEALLRALALIRSAQSEKELDEAAKIFAAGAAKIGIAVLIAAIARGAAKKASRWTEKKPSLRNTPQEKAPAERRYVAHASGKRPAAPQKADKAGVEALERKLLKGDKVLEDGSKLIEDGGKAEKGLAAASGLEKTAQNSAHAAESATGAFSPGAKLGGDLGIFAERELTITPKGLDLVRGHLAQFGDVPANTAMLERLEGAMTSGQRVTGADAIFYTHEAAEATMMGRGLSYDAAHAAALKKYGVSPFSVYHPDVIRSMPEHFNSNWYKFWGIE